MHPKRTPREALEPTWTALGENIKNKSKKQFSEGHFWSPFWALFESWSPFRALCERKRATSFRNNFLTRLLVSLRIVPKLQSLVNTNKNALFAISDLGSKIRHVGTHFDTQIRHYTHFETLEWAFGCNFWCIELRYQKKQNCRIASWSVVNLSRASVRRGGNYARHRPSTASHIQEYPKPACRPRKLSNMTCCRWPTPSIVPPSSSWGPR